MKRKTLIILSFLLALYIVPAILVPSSLAPARQNEPNMTKDFSNAVENTTANTASYGQVGGAWIPHEFLSYAATFVDDIDYWAVVADDGDAGNLTLWFKHYEDYTVIKAINYHFLWYIPTAITNELVKAYNFAGSTWDTIETPAKSSSGIPYWENGTISNPNYWNATHVGIQLSATHNDIFPIAWDYAYITYDYMIWNIVGIAQLWFDMPQWNIIATAIIQFWTPLDTTYLDWLLIFLGLIMIPASTLYLVKGGKDGMSANKFFYFVVAFMLGWGLLLGGIM